MTSSAAIIISLTFFIHNLTLVYDSKIFTENDPESKLVYISSVCLFLQKICLFPNIVWSKLWPICFIIEILLSIITLESSVIYIWKPIEQYLLRHADDILVHIYEETNCEWLICLLCSGISDCSDTFARLVWANDSMRFYLDFYKNLFDARMWNESYEFITTINQNDNSLSPLETNITRNRIERTSSKRWRGSVRRLVAATVYNLSCFTHGCSTGWVSGVLGNEALSGGAWLAALPCLVALPAAPMLAVLADTKGRKAGAFCICISFITSWLLAAWCGARGVWAARIAAGVGGAGALALAPLYCAEIAPRTKGLAAMPALACSCGILFAYLAGGLLSAHSLSLSMTAPPIVLLFSLVWLPETPSFLISVGKVQEAAKIMCWFDGSDFREDLTDVIEQQEVRIRISEGYGRKEVMRRQDSDTFQPMLKRISGLESNSDREKVDKSACKELFQNAASRRALFSCVVLMSAAAGSGAGAVNSFATAVVQHSVHRVPVLNDTAYNFTIYNGTVPRALIESSEAGSMLCGTALVLGAAVATVTVDKIGRKTLLLLSCSGIACGLTILGVYCDPQLRMHSWYLQRVLPLKRTNYKEKVIRERLEIQSNYTLYNTTPPFLNDSSKQWYRVSSKEHNFTISDWSVNYEKSIEKEDITIWLPVILLSMVLFLYNIGLGSVPFVLISDLFSVNVRSLASSFLIAWMWTSNFLLLRYFGTIAILFGLHATYYICAAITLVSAGYIYFVIPETKGKSQSQIEEALQGPWLLLMRKRKNQR